MRNGGRKSDYVNKIANNAGQCIKRITRALPPASHTPCNTISVTLSPSYLSLSQSLQSERNILGGTSNMARLFTSALPLRKFKPHSHKNCILTSLWKKLYNFYESAFKILLTQSLVFILSTSLKRTPFPIFKTKTSNLLARLYP